MKRGEEGGREEGKPGKTNCGLIKAKATFEGATATISPSPSEGCGPSHSSLTLA